MGFFRADYDGYRWWNTVWPVNRELESKELIAELDSVYDAFLKTFPNLDSLRSFCREKAEPTSDPTEFNAYLDGEYGFYWLRLITRFLDYNLYLHCYAKEAILK